MEHHGIASDMMHGFNWDKWTRTTGKPAERLTLIPAGQLKGRRLSGAADTLARSASTPLQQNVPNDQSLHYRFIRLLTGLLGQVR